RVDRHVDRRLDDVAGQDAARVVGHRRRLGAAAGAARALTGARSRAGGAVHGVLQADGDRLVPADLQRRVDRRLDGVAGQDAAGVAGARRRRRTALRPAGRVRAATGARRDVVAHGPDADLVGAQVQAEVDRDLYGVAGQDALGVLHRAGRRGAGTGAGIRRKVRRGRL